MLTHQQTGLNPFGPKGWARAVGFCLALAAFSSLGDSQPIARAATRARPEEEALLLLSKHSNLLRRPTFQPPL